MTTFAQLQQDIHAFWQLPYHQDKQLAEKLYAVQAWQRNRIQNTHRALFADSKYQPMGEFLINQLYGGEKFNQLAKLIERIADKAEKAEKFIPQAAAETGVAGVQAAMNAIKLDLELAQYLQRHDLPINENTMIQAYRDVNHAAERRAQIAELKTMCLLSDKYLKGFMLQKAFSFAKPMAYKSGFQPLYDFIAEGFSAIKPIKSIEAFIEPFCAKELAIIDNVHTGKPQPFDV